MQENQKTFTESITEVRNLCELLLQKIENV